MRLRKPGMSLPKEPAQPKSGLCRQFKVELITPLYGGGVEAGQPDETMPIRAAAIRGQLRFWWRVLNPNADFAAEKAIWGGMSSSGAAVASRVQVIIKKQLQNMVIEDIKTWQRRHHKKVKVEGKDKVKNFVWDNGAGYALGVLNDTNIKLVLNQENALKLPEFTLEIRITSALKPTDKNTVPMRVAQDIWDNEVFPALCWWASFGGLGARTRRGLGSVKVASISSTGNDAYTEELRPVTQADVARLKSELKAAAKTEAEAQNIECSYLLKQISANGNLYIGRDKNEALKAWVTAVGKLKDFRQGENIGRKERPYPNSDLRRDNTPGRSFWPEPDSIRKITGCSLSKHSKVEHVPIKAIPSFPRALFGLPIITQFGVNGQKGGENKQRDPAETKLYPVINNEKKHKDRMASPLILKAMWTGKDYAAIALLLPYQHALDMALELTGPEPLPKRMQPEEWWSPQAQTAMLKEGKVPLKHDAERGKEVNILQSFLQFFTEGDKKHG